MISETRNQVGYKVFNQNVIQWISHFSAKFKNSEVSFRVDNRKLNKITKLIAHFVNKKSCRCLHRAFIQNKI